MICWNCQQTKGLPEKPNRLDTCPRCTKFLHCCLNCRFYDQNFNNECRESQAEWVHDKKMANFCGYFYPKNSEGTKSSLPKMLSKNEAEKRWAELFKKK